MNNSQAQIPGRSHEESMPILGLSVSDSFLSTMRIPLLIGRDLSPSDDETGPRVILVNETLTRRAFPDENPVGQILTINGRDHEIVGVFGDITYADLKRSVEPTVFYPYRQNTDSIQRMFYEVRTASDPMALVARVRNAVASVDPSLPLADIKTQAIQLDESIAQERCFAALASGLAILTVLLSCIGLYSLMAYSVTRRIGEIGIRIALGAAPNAVTWSLLRGALLTTTAGLAVGLPVILVVTRIVRNQLFGVEPHDPATIAGASVLLCIIATAAAWLPARQAARVDPMVALRCE
jgi:macrolide transport system ATP-binding/permease protein